MEQNQFSAKALVDGFFKAFLKEKQLEDNDESYSKFMKSFLVFKHKEFDLKLSLCLLFGTEYITETPEGRVIAFNLLQYSDAPMEYLVTISLTKEEYGELVKYIIKEAFDWLSAQHDLANDYASREY